MTYRLIPVAAPAGRPYNPQELANIEARLNQMNPAFRVAAAFFDRVGQTGQLVLVLEGPPAPGGGTDSHGFSA